MPVELMPPEQVSAHITEAYQQLALPTTGTCVNCGEPFQFPMMWAYTANKHTPKYCGERCRRQRLQREKNRQPEYKRAKRARKRARRRGLKETCERCDYGTRPEILTVHHRDGNPSNNDLSNLQCLCPNCHAIVHLEERKQRQSATEG